MQVLVLTDSGLLLQQLQAQVWGLWQGQSLGRLGQGQMQRALGQGQMQMALGQEQVQGSYLQWRSGPNAFLRLTSSTKAQLYQLQHLHPVASQVGKHVVKLRLQVVPRRLQRL